VDYAVSLDTISVREGISEIVSTLWQALLLITLVVFLFLQSFRATLIPALTMPVALVGTFIFFPMLGFSINSLSLVIAIALILAEVTQAATIAGKRYRGGLASYYEVHEAQQLLFPAQIALS
jgi:HAE1 family hydrophobic/amphiphilic exporter-1